MTPTSLTPQEQEAIQREARNFVGANVGVADPFGDREYGYTVGATHERIKAREREEAVDAADIERLAKLLRAIDEKDARITSLESQVKRFKENEVWARDYMAGQDKKIEGLESQVKQITEERDKLKAEMK